MCTNLNDGNNPFIAIYDEKDEQTSYPKYLKHKGIVRIQ